MMKKFLSLIAAFSLGSLASFEALAYTGDIWDVSAIESRDNPVTRRSSDPVLPGEKVTFLIKLVNRDCNYNSDSPANDGNGYAWKFSSSTDGWKYPTITVDVGGHLAAAQIVDVGPSWYNETRLTWVICEYTAKPGDLADPFRIYIPETTGAYQVLPFASSTPAVSIVSEKGASEKITWTIYDGPEDLGDRRNNHNLATSGVKVRGATFGKGDSEKEGVWFSISENSTDSANKIEPSIKLLGWDNGEEATPLYIWSKDKKIISLEGENLIPVENDVYRLAFRDGECRFSLRAKGAENASTKIYVAPTIGTTAVGGADQHCLIATVDITKAEPSSISVLFDGTYAKDGQAIKVPSSTKPNMTLSLGGKALNESVKIKLTAKYYSDDESKWVEDTEHKYIKFSSTANSENHNSEFTLDPKETKTVYYTLYGAPKHTDPEDDKSGILIIPEILEIGTGDEIAADKINSGRIIVTPDPSATLDLSGAFYNGHSREVSLTIRDTPRNLAFPDGRCPDGLSKQDGYTIKWFNDENGDVSFDYDTTKTGENDPKITFNAGEVVLSGINYDEAETYTSRIEITTPDGAVYKETFQVVVSALPTVKLVRVGHDLDDPIDENGDNFYFVLENPTEAMKKAIQNKTTSYYAFIKSDDGSKLVDGTVKKTPLATGTRSGVKIEFKDGVYKTAAFPIYFVDNCNVDNEATYPVLTPIVVNKPTWSKDKPPAAVDNIGGQSATLRVNNAIPKAQVLDIDADVRINSSPTFTADVIDGAKDLDLTDLPLIKDLKVADNPYADDAIGKLPAFLTEWSIYIPGKNDPYLVCYTYGLAEDGSSAVLPKVKEFPREGDYAVETRMFDKDMLTEWLENKGKLPSPMDPKADGTANITPNSKSHFASWNAKNSIWNNLEWNIHSDEFPVGRIEFKASNNPGMVITLDENGQKNLGWYEGVGTPTFTVALDEMIESQDGKVFEIEFKDAVTGAKAPDSVIEILTSDIVSKGTGDNAGKYLLTIPGRSEGASFSIYAKDGKDNSRWTLTLTELNNVQSFMPGKVSFYIYNLEPVVTVTSGIGAMVAAMKNQTNIVINADAGIEYEIRWNVTNETTNNNYDGLEITWSNSNNRDTDKTFTYTGDTEKDKDNYVWKTSFVSPTKEDGAGHVITLAWQDKDGAANSYSWEVRVGASKTISLYPMGPTTGVVNSGLNNKYNVVDGKGVGVVSVTGYEQDKEYDEYHRWKVGNVADVNVKAKGSDHTAVIEVEDDPASYDSFFYTWLTAIRLEGAAGYQVERFGSPLPDKEGATTATLPTETNEDGSYSDTIYEAVFSKEWKIEDNCGDINQDGIPDIFVAKYGFGLFNDGDLIGNDLIDLAEFNDDEDYLPYPTEINAAGVIGTTNSWIDTARAFTAKTEIRGYKEGLNLRNATIIPGTAAITSDTTYGPYVEDPKHTDIENWAWMMSGFDPNWTAENPTDPTKADTDGDGFPDGYEYALWYRAHVGYLRVEENGDLTPLKQTGRRFKLNEYNLPDYVEITSTEIEERFNPTVAIPDDEKTTCDLDNDGIADWLEYQLGTNPCDADTDGDGIPDGWEVSMGMNPLNGGDGAKGGSNPDGDAMAVAKAYLLTFVVDGESQYWMVPEIDSTYSEMPNAIAALKTDYVSVQKKNEVGLPEVDEKGNPVFELKVKYDIKPGTEIIGAVLDARPTRVDIPGTKNLIAVAASELKSRKLYFPEGATDIEYSKYVIGENGRTGEYTLIHDQVYNFYGFDPRTGWSIGDDDGLLGNRWSSIKGNADKYGLENYGSSKLTQAFSSIHEYGLGYYKIHTLGAGVDYGHLVSSLVGLSTNPTTADSDNDGMPDGWELYVGLNPKSSPDNSDFDQDTDHDGLTNAEEFFGTDSCRAYVGCASIEGKAAKKWLNKHWPTDPNDADTDGDSLNDGIEASSFCYTADDVDDGIKVIYRGGGLNPNSIDTDLDGLPDGWEAQFAGYAIEVEGDSFNLVGNETALDKASKLNIYPISNQIADGFVGDLSMTTASGRKLAEGKRFVVNGMDGTFEQDVATVKNPGDNEVDFDPVTGTIRDYDFDHDGLENYQEYLTQAIRAFRYDDTETPLMGRAIIWKGDVNDGSAAKPRVALSEPIELDDYVDTPELIFPTFNFSDPTEFIKSMQVKSGEDPVTGKDVYVDGPLLKAIKIADNAYMNSVTPSEASPVTSFFVSSEGISIRVDDKWVLCTEIEKDRETYPDYEITWKTDADGNPDYTRPPTVIHSNEGNTKNVVLPGGYDYAATGYLALPKQTWDMAGVSWKLGNSSYTRRAKYMLPPSTMTHYYTKNTQANVNILAGENDGTTDGFGSKRIFATGYVSTSPRSQDTDNDGMDDYYELYHGLNPVYGKTDVIFEKYVAAISADKNLWTYLNEGTDEKITEKGVLFDAIKYPWTMGHPDADPDGDSFRNYNEAIVANMASPTTYHTDPTPRWMTDASGVLSYVRQYYSYTTDLVGMPWYHATDNQFDGYTGHLNAIKGYIASFEQNEGYDTDGDFVGDSNEIVKSTMPSSDPKDFTDPARRQAMYFPGANSAMMTRADAVVNSWDCEDVFHTFTVECWINPEAVDKEQVVFERVHWYEASKKGETGHYRANFRIGLDAAGRVYGLFDNDSGSLSASDTARSTQVITGPTLAADQWIHVAMTFDGLALKLYTNGHLEATVRTSNDSGNQLIPANGVTAIAKVPEEDFYPRSHVTEMEGAFVVGATMTDGWHAIDGRSFANLDKYFQGYVDEIRVWDGAREAVDIEANYMKSFSKDDALENRDLVYDAWKYGATRNDKDGRPALPAELRACWGFGTLPAALNAENVAKVPAGFDEAVMSTVQYAGVDVPASYFSNGGYLATFPEELRSSVYKTVSGDYMCVPVAHNLVQQLPVYDGSLPDSEFWSEYISGLVPITEHGLDSYLIPNSMNPYAESVVLGSRVLHNWRLSRYAEITKNDAIEELARKYRFDTRSIFSASTDLYPLGGAFAKLVSSMWDKNGPTDAWTDTVGSALTNEEGESANTEDIAHYAWNIPAGVIGVVPEYWLASKGQTYVESTSASDIIDAYNQWVNAGKPGLINDSTTEFPEKLGWKVAQEVLDLIDSGDITEWWLVAKGKRYAESASAAQALIDFKNETKLPTMPQWYLVNGVRGIIGDGVDQVPEWWLVYKGYEYCSIADVDKVLADYASDCAYGLLDNAPDTNAKLPKTFDWDIKPEVKNLIVAGTLPEWWFIYHGEEFSCSVDAQVALQMFASEKDELLANDEIDFTAKLDATADWEIDPEVLIAVPEWWLAYKGEAYATSPDTTSARARAAYELNMAHGLLDTPDMSAKLPELDWELTDAVLNVVPEWWLVYKGETYTENVTPEVARLAYLDDVVHGILDNDEIDKMATILDTPAWKVAPAVLNAVPEWWLVQMGKDYAESVTLEGVKNDFDRCVQVGGVFGIVDTELELPQADITWNVSNEALAAFPEWWLNWRGRNYVELTPFEQMKIDYKNDTSVPGTPQWWLKTELRKLVTDGDIPEWWFVMKGRDYSQTATATEAKEAYEADMAYDFLTRSYSDVEKANMVIPFTYTWVNMSQAVIDAVPEWWLVAHGRTFAEQVNAENALTEFAKDEAAGRLEAMDKTAKLPRNLNWAVRTDVLEAVPEWWLYAKGAEYAQSVDVETALHDYALDAADKNATLPELAWGTRDQLYQAGVLEWWLVWKGEDYVRARDTAKLVTEWLHERMHQAELLDPYIIDREATIDPTPLADYDVSELPSATMDKEAKLPVSEWAIEKTVKENLPKWWLASKGKAYAESATLEQAIADYEADRLSVTMYDFDAVMPKIRWAVSDAVLAVVPRWWLVQKGQAYAEDPDLTAEKALADFEAERNAGKIDVVDRTLKLPVEKWNVSESILAMVPEWWLVYKGQDYAESAAVSQVIYDYLSDIAKGLQPDGTIKEDYAATSDVNTNGIPDWWESLYGLDGKTYDTDNDGLPDYIEYYVSEILAPTLKLSIKLDPNNQMSDGLTLDYFVKLGDLYLGEIFTDHDQMDDVWENGYDMSAVSRYIYDPNNDPDKDGWSNYAEYRAKTDPTSFAAKGFMGIQNAEYPIPSIEFTVSTDTDISADAKFIVQAKRSVLPHEEDDGGYDATWYVGMSSNVTQVVDFTHTWSKSGSSSANEEKPYTKYIGRYLDGTQTLHLSPGSITPGSVKIHIYDPEYTVLIRETGRSLIYPDAIEWEDIAVDVEGDLIVSTHSRKIGTVDYKTGTITINYTQIPLAIDLAFNLANGDQKDSDGNTYSTTLDTRNAYYGIEWKAQPVNGGRYNTYYLSEADVGHLREGKNDFIAFLDENSDGEYTIGEPFGAVNGVDVGWDAAKVSIKLTKTNPLFPRFDIMSGENDRDYWYGTPATSQTSSSTTTTEDGTEVTFTPDSATLNGRLVRVRVIRHSTDIGEFTKDKQVAIFDKYLNLDKRGYLHEGDILKSGEYDLDWTAAKDIFSGTTDFGRINYVVVVGENGEYTNTTKIARHYDTKAAGGRVAAMNLKDVHCYGARPSFSWMMRPARESNLEFNTYTAFSIKILSGSDVIYNSGTQKMPPIDQDGYCNWTAPISFGDIVRGDKKYSVLPYSGDFTWRIAIYNSKFQDDSLYAEGKLSASVESEGKFVEGHGYGSLDVTLNYAGPALLLDEVGKVTGGLPKGQIRVEAFETPDFAGEAVASAFAQKVDGELKAMVCGLEIDKAYYLRAYLDSDGDQKKSDWESWGATTVPTTVTPVPNKVSFYLEDCDTDQDWLPDAWEYAKAGNLTTLGGNNEKKLTATEGLWSLQLQGSMSLDKPTQQKLLVAPSADTFVTQSFASLLLGAPIDISDDGAIKGQIEDGSLVITGFTVANGKVTINLDATVSSVLNTALAKLYKVEDNLKVKVVVLHVETLDDDDWTEAGSKENVTFGGEAQTIEINLEPGASANGFYKVKIAQ